MQSNKLSIMITIFLLLKIKIWNRWTQLDKWCTKQQSL